MKTLYFRKSFSSIKGSVKLLMSLILLSIAPVYCNAQTYWTDENNYDTSWFDESAQEYSISTPEQLAGLAVLCNEVMPDDEGLLENIYFKNKIIRLASDIDLSGHIWLPCNLDLGYKGMFDGNNHTIDNMLIAPERPDQNPTGLYGLFAQCARIKNLTIGANSKITIPVNFTNVVGVGGIAGSSYNIENCVNNASIDFLGTTLEGGDGIGGVAAVADSVKNCINNGDIFAQWGHIHIGGIVGGNEYGHIHTFIDGCVNNGNIEVNKPFNSEGYDIEVGGISANYNRYSERKEFQVINSGNTGNIHIHAECDWYGSSTVRANAISTSNSIQNCFNHGVVTIEGKNGNCFSSIMAPQCENCYTTKNIIIENIDKSFYILPDCYSFGDNSRFCYTPNDFSIKNGTPVNDMTAQSFCDLLNANIILLDNKELRNWIQGPDLYPIVTDYKNEEPDMGISEIEINPSDNSTGIYLLNGQKVDSISKLPKGSIYIVNGTKYLKNL